MAEHYDVIIVGTGAGGGTLAHTLAPSGKRILLIERGGFLPREKENWEPEAVFVEGRYTSSDSWKDNDGQAFQPGVHYYVGGATKLYGAALYRLRPGDFGELKHADGISPAWPVSYDGLRAVVHEGRVALPGARQPWRRPDGGRLEPPVPLPRRQPRAPDPTDQRRPREGRLPPLPRALRHPPRRGRPADQQLHPLHVVRRLPLLVHAKADAETIAVLPALEHPNVTLLVDTEVTRLQTEPAAARSPASSPSTGAPKRSSPPTSLSSRPGPPTAPDCCCPRPVTPTPTGWPTARTRSDGTTCSTTPRQSWRWARSPTTPRSKRPWD